MRKFRFHVGYGAVIGSVWFWLNELINPHGTASLYGKLLVDAITGGLVYVTLWQPTSFMMGAVMGAFWGT